MSHRSYNRQYSKNNHRYNRDSNNRDGNNRYSNNRDGNNSNRERPSKQEQYERNYQWVIRNISDNLKRGSYRNISSLQKDLERLQNNDFCQANNKIKIEDSCVTDEWETPVYVKSQENRKKLRTEQDDVFLPLNKILKYNNTNERREPQTLNHSKKQFSSISKTQSIQVRATDEDEDIIYNFKAYSHIDLDKTGEKDEFTFCFLFQLSNLYKLLSGRERREYRSQLYRKIVAKYDSKDLYHKLGYSERRMNRNGMKYAMMRQAPLDLLGQILLMDYFKVNILVYKPDKKQFYTYLQHNDKYVNVLLKYQHNKFVPMEMNVKDIVDNKNQDDNDETEAFYSMKTLSPLIEENIIDLDPENTVNPFTKQKLKSFSAYKLADLRELADSLSIELNKLNGQKEKKKTKRELYDEIKALYEI
jgi:hypothetical protein